VCIPVGTTVNAPVNVPSLMLYVPVVVSVAINCTVMYVPFVTRIVLLSMVAPLIWRAKEMAPVVPVLLSWAEMVTGLFGHASLGLTIRLLILMIGAVGGGVDVAFGDEDGWEDGEVEDEGGDDGEVDVDGEGVEVAGVDDELDGADAGVECWVRE
jgi:hypothetical protein